jgi:23S rRNA pseudouridine2457 synthase
MSPYRVYAILNKPYGVLSQFTADQPDQQTLSHIVMLPDDVYPVGRLDKDSEGLLLLTNDKSINNKLLDPKNKHPRTYWAQVEGVPSEQDLAPFSTGIKIKTNKEYYTTKPARVRILDNVEIYDRNPPIRYRKYIPETWLEIQLTEGKNRQVRKMTAAIGFPTLRLVRVAIGNLELGDLKPGELRMLNEEWVKLALFGS